MAEMRDPPVSSPPDHREDGWYRMAGPDWRDWPLVSDADAEAEIAAGGGADLMHLEFGVAEPMDPADYAERLAEVRRRAALGPREAPS